MFYHPINQSWNTVEKRKEWKNKQTKMRTFLLSWSHNPQLQPAAENKLSVCLDWNSETTEFRCLSSNISSTKTEAKISIGKAGTVIDGLWTTRKSDLSNWIKCSSCVSTIVWLYHLDSNETRREKTRWDQHKDAAYSFEQIQKPALNKKKNLYGHLPPSHKLSE